MPKVPDRLNRNKKPETAVTRLKSLANAESSGSLESPKTKIEQIVKTLYEELVTLNARNQGPELHSDRSKIAENSWCTDPQVHHSPADSEILKRIEKHATEMLQHKATVMAKPMKSNNLELCADALT